MVPRGNEIVVGEQAVTKRKTVLLLNCLSSMQRFAVSRSHFLCAYLRVRHFHYTIITPYLLLHRQGMDQLPCMLQVWTTLYAHEGIEDCRKSCGGQGYLRSSGICDLTTGHTYTRVEKIIK